jgi:hypothetical protein
MTSRILRRVQIVSASLLAVILIVAAGSTDLQASKIPLIKKKGGGSGEQTFVGKISSIDLKNRVLVVTTTEGEQQESFEYKKGVRVTSAHQAGEMKVSDLKTGMLVTLYIKASKSSSQVYEILIMS